MRVTGGAKVGLYQDLRGTGLGGGEYVLGVLAEAVRAAGHTVDVVHHQRAGLVDRMAAFFELDLNGVTDRPLPLRSRWGVPEAPAWRLGAAMRDWMREASAPYDLFVCVTHAPPPFCHARAGVLYVLFPLYDQPNSWPANVRGGPVAWLRRRVYGRLWRRRIASYREVAAISAFSAHWTQARWGVPAEVVFPPVDVDRFAPGVKENRVVSLGRFCALKDQAGMARAFRAVPLPGWRFCCAGGLADSDGDRAYLAEVGRAGGDAVELVANAPRDRVLAELGRAKVFWHAMGLDDDPGADPARAEHFGIATVEAMAAGCVPVVPNRGGQPEIVTHGETGFLCESLDEYPTRTAELAADPARRERMAAAARDRARAFAKPVFAAGMMRLLNRHLPPAPEAHA